MDQTSIDKVDFETDNPKELLQELKRRINSRAEFYEGEYSTIKIGKRLEAEKCVEDIEMAIDKLENE